MSQAECLVPRFSITLLLRNRQAHAPGGLCISILPNDAPESARSPACSESVMISAESDTLSAFLRMLRIRASDIRIGFRRCVALIASYPAGISHLHSWMQTSKEGRARNS
jgi:hypothetical protein